MRCYICQTQSGHLLRVRREDTNYIASPYVHLCWKCTWAKLRRKL